MDDFGGAEETKEKALESFEAMGRLLKEVGIEESEEKAEGDGWELNLSLSSCVAGPLQRMTYLGVTYDTVEGTATVSLSLVNSIMALKYVLY